MDESFRRILLTRVHSHEDMLSTTPAIGSLKKNYLDAKVDVLLYQDTIPILSENPEISVLYGIKNRGTKASEKITNFFHPIKVLRANKYDLAVNLTDQWTVAILACLLNTRVRISQGYHYRQSTFWCNSFTRLVLLQGGSVVESNLSVLTPLGPESLVRQTTMSHLPASWERMCRKLDHAGVEQDYVVIQPMAWQIFKCQDNAKFSVVIDALHARGYEVVLTSDPDKDNLACANETAQECQMPPVTALAGKMTLPEFGALIDHAQLFIGVDSAPTYIAVTANMPLMSLFGATDHILWRPWSNDMIQFWAGDYREVLTRGQRDRSEMYPSVTPAANATTAVDKLLPSSTTGTSL